MAAVERTELGISQIAWFIDECPRTSGVRCHDSRSIAEVFILMLRGWQRSSRVPAATTGDIAPASGVRLLNARALLTLGLTLGYAAVLIGHIPFWLATTLFVAAFTGFFGPREHTYRRRIISALVAGLLTALVVILVFENIFLVRLP